MSSNAVKKKMLIAAYRTGWNRTVSGFLREMAIALEEEEEELKETANSIDMSEDEMDSILREILWNAGIEVMECPESHKDNICLLLERMNEIYNSPEDLLQTLVEGLLEGAERHGTQSEITTILEKICKTLDIPLIRLKKHLLFSLA